MAHPVRALYTTAGKTSAAPRAPAVRKHHKSVPLQLAFSSSFSPGTGPRRHSQRKSSSFHHTEPSLEAPFQTVPEICLLLKLKREPSHSSRMSPVPNSIKTKRWPWWHVIVWCFACFNFLTFFFKMCVDVFACIKVSAPAFRNQKGASVPWDWSHRWLWVTTEDLGIASWSSGWAASELQCYAVSPVP